MAAPTQAPAEVIQLVGRGGTRNNNVFNDEGMKRLIASCDAAKDHYTVVSIIGPQSSGKSTLLNAVFQTNFCVMDARLGRAQTTQGIWAALCDSRVVVLDIEGTDSGELLQNDLGFENRSALFALVVSDVIFVNMWLHNVGLFNGIPLLTNIFQERAKKAYPNELPEQHKTKIVFALRDYDGMTPKELLVKKISSMINEIWKSIPQREDSRLDKYFKLEVELFPNLVFEKDKFGNKCAEMRERIRDALVHRRRDSLALRDFPSDAKEIWEKVVKNKTLDLPSQRETRARTACRTVANEKFQHLIRNMEVLEGKECPREFEKELNQIKNHILSEYKNETQVYGLEIANEEEKLLIEEILQHAERTFKSVMAKFKNAIIDNIIHEVIPHMHGKHTGQIEEHINHVVSKYSSKFLQMTEDINSYRGLINMKMFLDKLVFLGQRLATDTKRINKKKLGVTITTGIFAGLALATGGVGGIAVTGGHMIAASASGIVATAATGAAAGTGIAFGTSQKDVKRYVEGIKSEFFYHYSSEGKFSKID